jgi:hypothetical protein
MHAGMLRMVAYGAYPQVAIGRGIPLGVVFPISAVGHRQKKANVYHCREGFEGHWDQAMSSYVSEWAGTKSLHPTGVELITPSVRSRFALRPIAANYSHPCDPFDVPTVCCNLVATAACVEGHLHLTQGLCFACSFNARLKCSVGCPSTARTTKRRPRSMPTTRWPLSAMPSHLPCAHPVWWAAGG